MKIELNTGLLPLFNINTYENCMLNGDNLTERLAYDIEESELSKEEKEQFYNKLCYEWNNNKWEEYLNKKAQEYLDEILEDLVYHNIVNMKRIKDTKIDSPREYNFRGDELDFTVEITEEEFNRIKNLVIDDEEFYKWIYKTYKSYDGFMSFMPYYRGDFIKAVNGEDIERSFIMMIMYLIKQSKQFNREMIQMDFEEKVNDGNVDVWDFIDKGICSKLYDKI